MSGAKCTPITSSFRPASWPKACSSISRSSPPSWFGTRSDRGCAPFVPASRRQNSSSPTGCATCFPVFSSVPQKTVPSQNSSPIAKTQQTCKDFAWHHEKKPALLSTKLGDSNRTSSHNAEDLEDRRRRSCRLGYHRPSRSHCVAALSRFLTLIQSLDRPDRYGEPNGGPPWTRLSCATSQSISD